MEHTARGAAGERVGGGRSSAAPWATPGGCASRSLERAAHDRRIGVVGRIRYTPAFTRAQRRGLSLVECDDDPAADAVRQAARHPSEAQGGAGPRTVQEFVKRGAEVVLTGNVGTNAREALETAGLKMVLGVEGKVRDVVQKYVASRPSEV